MTTSTEVRPTRRGRFRSLVHHDIVAVVAVSALAAGVAFAFLRAPATIDAIEVTNPTDYSIAIQVRGADGGWVPMSTAQRRATTTVRDVIDQGGTTWTFRLTAQGQRAGELHLGRDELEAAGWTIEIPASAEQALREAGAQPPP